jgi:hypothetical protein
VARTIFIHSIAFPSTLQGIAPDHLRFSVLAPALDLGFIDDARKRFQEKSAYLDDRPNAPLRFLTEANLTQIIERQKQLCDPGTIRDELNDRIARTYLAGEFELNKFPGTAGEVQDEVGGGKPLLVLLSYDSVSIGIRASFERRGVGIPQDVPFALTEEFLGDPQKTRQWNAFVSRLYPGSESPSLEEVGVLLRAFLLPCILSVSAPESTAHYWTPSLHWSEQQ